MCIYIYIYTSSLTIKADVVCIQETHGCEEDLECMTKQHRQPYILYVCVYIYIYIYTHIYIYIYILFYLYISLSLYIYIYIYIHTYIEREREIRLSEALLHRRAAEHGADDRVQVDEGRAQYLSLSLYIYIYRERERYSTYIYIYIYICSLVPTAMTS